MKGKDQDEKKQNNLSKYNAYKIRTKKKTFKKTFHLIFLEIFRKERKEKEQSVIHRRNQE